MWCATFSPDGCYLATSSADTTVIIWDATDGTFPILHVLSSHARPVALVAWSPKVGSAGHAGYIYLFQEGRIFSIFWQMVLALAASWRDHDKYTSLLVSSELYLRY